MEKHSLLPTGDSAWKCCLFLGMLLLAHAPSTAHGQQLVTGDAIRVRASRSTEPDPQWTDATVVRLTPDTLWYEARGSVLPISVDNVEIQRPTFRDRRWAGLGIGALAGGAVGALVAYSSFEPRFGFEGGLGALFCFFGCDPGPQVQVNSRNEETAGGAVGGAVLGGTLGFFVGKVLGRWETVELDQLTLGGGALSLSFRIRR